MQNKRSKTKQPEEESSSENKDIGSRLVELQAYMTNFAYSLTRDYEDAQDLVMCVNEKVLSNPDKFRDDKNFKGWVSLIMKNEFINSYRKTKRRGDVVIPDCDPYQLSDESIPRSEASDSDVIFQQLMQQVKEIPNHELLLGYMNGYTYDQLADITELPIGTIKSRIWFARKHLRKFMQSLK